MLWAVYEAAGRVRRWIIAGLLLTTVSLHAGSGPGCGSTPPLGRESPLSRVQGGSILEALYHFAHRNGICLGVVLNEKALLESPAKAHFGNASTWKILIDLVPHGYRIHEEGRVVVIQPVASTPAWLAQRIPRFRLERAEPVRFAVLASLYMHYEMARDPQRRTGFAGDVLGADNSNMIGPMDERGKTVKELLNIIAERSRGALWIALVNPKWEFIEYQWPQTQGVLMLRSISENVR